MNLFVQNINMRSVCTFSPFLTRKTATLLLLISGSRSIASTVAAATADAASSAVLQRSRPTALYRTVQVHVVHRHGDRTPITPLNNPEYWEKQLIPPSQLEKIAQGTKIIRHSDNVESNEQQPFTHQAHGRGPFGKLTQLGLWQMVEVGTMLRERYDAGSAVRTSNRLVVEDKQDEIRQYNPHVWDSQRPLCPSNIRVYSTDFPRTIQSVQGLLLGLFHSSEDDGNVSSKKDDVDQVIPIDVRHTNIMIPDPEPRHTHEQVELENALALQPHILEKEEMMRLLAVRVSQALEPLLADDARLLNFDLGNTKKRQNQNQQRPPLGQAGEETGDHPGDMSIETEPLSWVQLAEITKCLRIRNLLPPDISEEDQEVVAHHAAWRWFQSFRHPRLVYLAMHRWMKCQLDSLCQYENNKETSVPVTIWSGHDSSLIGLLCAYRLAQPSQWPEYASYLLIELLERVEMKDLDNDDQRDQKKELMVRFSLNGETLASQWIEGESLEMIPLSLLKERIRKMGSEGRPLSVTSQ